MKSCLFHKWNGCTCLKCGENRGTSHKWNNCKCEICGFVRKDNHRWQGCKCEICGTLRDEEHAITIENCIPKCSICNKQFEAKHHFEMENICTTICRACGTIKYNHDWKDFICKKCNKKCTIDDMLDKEERNTIFKFTEWLCKQPFFKDEETYNHIKDTIKNPQYEIDGKYVQNVLGTINWYFVKSTDRQYENYTKDRELQFCKDIMKKIVSLNLNGE